ncbi:MAG: alpha/beta fold hydrolase [Acidobacteria bacterium]|nr:alpha/beta fold hydrolase [Acidobacteriota bacterium]
MTRRDCLLAWPMAALAASQEASSLLARVRAGMREVMGPLPKFPRKRTPCRVVEESDAGKYMRRKILYSAEPGDEVPAYLLIPHSARRAPAMLCLHQTTKIGKAEPAGLGGKPNLHYAHELAERGYVALAPDYPNFGDYRFDPYTHGYQSASMKGIWNHLRAVDLLSSLGEVDRRRIGVIGHSLGGHNSLFAAAFEPRLRAVVTSCGFTSFPKYRNGDMSGWSHKGYMPKIETVYGKSPARMPFDFPELLAALAPRSVFINAPTRDSNFDVSGVDDCVNRARPLLGDRLVVVHPDCEHDFPPAVREQAYGFLNGALR